MTFISTSNRFRFERVKKNLLNNFAHNTFFNKKNCQKNCTKKQSKKLGFPRNLFSFFFYSTHHKQFFHSTHKQ